MSRFIEYEYLEQFNRMLELLKRFVRQETDSTYLLIIWAAIFLFGAINCILGYRLLRFWMMLFGFAAGAATGYFASAFVGVESVTTRGIVSLAMGAAAAILVFLIYNAGIFVIGAVIGFLASLYLIHPTSSQMFFLCIVIGVLLGVVTLKFRKIILITATSAIGAVLAGGSLWKLLGNPLLQLTAIAFFVLGMLMQLLINREKEEEEEEEEEEDINKRDSDYLGLFDSDEDDEDSYVPEPNRPYFPIPEKSHAPESEKPYGSEPRNSYPSHAEEKQREVFYYDLKKEREATERKKSGKRSQNKRNEDA